MEKGKHVWRDNGWCVVAEKSNTRLFKMKYHVGVFNKIVLIYHEGKVVFESEDVALIDNYLKLILGED